MPERTARKLFARACVLSLLAMRVAAGFAAEVSLKADSMLYDPEARLVRVEGNVHFTREDGELFGDRGYGNTDGTDFVLEGSVHGTFHAENTTISCGYMKLTTDAPGRRRRVLASGDAVLARGDDRLNAGTLSWEPGSENYRAEGRVLGHFASHAIDADLAARNGEQFWGKGVRRYEDRLRKMTIRADNLRGLIKKDKVQELEAFGNLVMNLPGQDGNMIRVTGDKSIFSEDRGTIVVSGNAAAVQEGSSVRAESLVMRLDTRRIEAIGKPSLTFEMKE